MFLLGDEGEVRGLFVVVPNKEDKIIREFHQSNHSYVHSGLNGELETSVWFLDRRIQIDFLFPSLCHRRINSFGPGSGR